ncbi:MAG TPA: aromatic ring-hydroxylating dioxygenase subunit alpha [Acidimicrobiales bacterium]|jgi:phenylpropionate dioxygenase-like ring-hydroxylating dioxygenase large terminal subunit
MTEQLIDMGLDVPFAMTKGTRVPAPRYFDREFARLEDERLWSRTWQMACRLEEIPMPGDYVTYTIGDQSLIVLRLDQDTIRAYSNACRHRGTQLAVGSGSFRGGQIACPFHGWRWNLDGTNSFVFGQEGFTESVTDPLELCLPQAGVGTWGGCVFVNLDPDAPPLLESIDPMPSLLDPLGIDLMKVVWWKAVDLPANWKLAMEAFIEGYHVMASHPQITQGQFDEYDPNSLAYEVHAGGHSHYINRPGAQRSHRRKIDYLDEVEALIEASRILGEGLEAMTLPRDLAVIETLRDRPVAEDASLGSELVKAIYEHAAQEGIALPRLKGPDLIKWGGVFFVFPNYFVLPQYGNALCYRFRPVPGDPERCLLELWSVSIPGAQDEPTRPVMAGPFAPDDTEHWPLIPLQDFANITRQQKGVHNRTFKNTRISHVYEVGIANLHEEVDRYLALPPPADRSGAGAGS